MLFKHLRRDDGVAHAGFVFETQKNEAFRGARSPTTVECQSSAEFSFSSPEIRGTFQTLCSGERRDPGTTIRSGEAYFRE